MFREGRRTSWVPYEEKSSDAVKAVRENRESGGKGSVDGRGRRKESGAFRGLHVYLYASTQASMKGVQGPQHSNKKKGLKEVEELRPIAAFARIQHPVARCDHHEEDECEETLGLTVVLGDNVRMFQ